MQTRMYVSSSVCAIGRPGVSGRLPAKRGRLNYFRSNLPWRPYWLPSAGQTINSRIPIGIVYMYKSKIESLLI